jgi:hypothetical protein
MAKGLNDAIRRDHRIILNHQALQLRRLHDMLLDREIGVHDERILVQEPDEFAVRELGESVSYCHHV